jgi:hypothetical protein
MGAQMLVADEVLRAVDADHVAMCRFDGVEHPTFQEVCSQITKAIEIKSGSADSAGINASVGV